MNNPAQFLRSPLFWCNLVYIAVLGALLLTGHFTLWWIGIAIYVIPIVCWLLFYWLPNRSKALRKHGRPLPPLRPDSILGGIYSDLPLADHFVLSKTKRPYLSKKTHNLYVSDLINDQGRWHYWIETSDDIVVACDFNFESSKSKFLNYSSGAGGGRFLSGNSG